MGYPQVTMGFKWFQYVSILIHGLMSLMTWMIWGVPPFLGSLHMPLWYPMVWLWDHNHNSYNPWRLAGAVARCNALMEDITDFQVEKSSWRRL